MGILGCWNLLKSPEIYAEKYQVLRLKSQWSSHKKFPFLVKSPWNHHPFLTQNNTKNRHKKWLAVLVIVLAALGAGHGAQSGAHVLAALVLGGELTKKVTPKKWFTLWKILGNIWFIANHWENDKKSNAWIGLRENLNRKPSIFSRNIWGFPVNVPLNQSIESNAWNGSPYEKSWEKLGSFPIIGKMLTTFFWKKNILRRNGSPLLTAFSSSSMCFPCWNRRLRRKHLRGHVELPQNVMRTRVRSRRAHKKWRPYSWVSTWQNNSCLQTSNVSCHCRHPINILYIHTYIHTYIYIYMIYRIHIAIRHQKRPYDHVTHRSHSHPT